MTDGRTLRRGPDGAGVDVTGRRTNHSGFLRLETFELSHALFGGGRSAVLRREVLRVGESVVALPYDPVRDTVLLLEQFRIGPLVLGDARPWTLETVAGHVDEGESPAEAARREAREEAGIALTALHPLGAFYASPGSSDERMHGFVGCADLGSAGGLHGLPGEGEDIRAMTVPFARAMEAVDSGEITGGPAMLVLLRFSSCRERLRTEWR